MKDSLWAHILFQLCLFLLRILPHRVAGTLVPIPGEVPNDKEQFASRCNKYAKFWKQSFKKSVYSLLEEQVIAAWHENTNTADIAKQRAVSWGNAAVHLKDKNRWAGACNVSQNEEESSDEEESQESAKDTSNQESITKKEHNKRAKEMFRALASRILRLQLHKLAVQEKACYGFLHLSLQALAHKTRAKVQQHKMDLRKSSARYDAVVTAVTQSAVSVVAFYIFLLAVIILTVSYFRQPLAIIVSSDQDHILWFKNELLGRDGLSDSKLTIPNVKALAVRLDEPPSWTEIFRINVGQWCTKWLFCKTRLYFVESLAHHHWHRNPFSHYRMFLQRSKRVGGPFPQYTSILLYDSTCNSLLKHTHSFGGDFEAECVNNPAVTMKRFERLNLKPFLPHSEYMMRIAIAHECKSCERCMHESLEILLQGPMHTGGVRRNHWLLQTPGSAGLKEEHAAPTADESTSASATVSKTDSSMDINQVKHLVATRPADMFENAENSRQKRWIQREFPLFHFTVFGSEGAGKSTTLRWLSIHLELGEKTSQRFLSAAGGESYTRRFEGVKMAPGLKVFDTKGLPSLDEVHVPGIKQLLLGHLPESCPMRWDSHGTSQSWSLLACIIWISYCCIPVSMILAYRVMGSSNVGVDGGHAGRGTGDDRQAVNLGGGGEDMRVSNEPGAARRASAAYVRAARRTSAGLDYTKAELVFAHAVSLEDDDNHGRIVKPHTEDRAMGDGVHGGGTVGMGISSGIYKIACISLLFIVCIFCIATAAHFSMQGSEGEASCTPKEQAIPRSASHASLFIVRYADEKQDPDGKHMLSVSKLLSALRNEDIDPILAVSHIGNCTGDADRAAAAFAVAVGSSPQITFPLCAILPADGRDSSPYLPPSVYPPVLQALQSRAYQYYSDAWEHAGSKERDLFGDPSWLFLVVFLAFLWSIGATRLQCVWNCILVIISSVLRCFKYVIKTMWLAAVQVSNAVPRLNFKFQPEQDGELEARKLAEEWRELHATEIAMQTEIETLVGQKQRLAAETMKEKQAREEKEARLKTDTSKLEARAAALKKREREAAKRDQKQFPSHWSSTQLLGEGEYLVPTRFVQDWMQRRIRSSMFTGPAAHGACGAAVVSARVTRVVRVENANLWRMYETRKQVLRAEAARGGWSVPRLSGKTRAGEAELKGMVLDGEVNEVLVWHGTSSDVADTVAKHCGFDERVSKLGGLYGAGVYFSDSSCKAHQYAQQYGTPRGEHVMLCCRVVMGWPCLTRSLHKNERRPPVNSQVGRPFDSIFAESGVGNGGTQVHNEFVIFNGYQAYPEYIVYYTV